ncbi:MAG: hypothetical protein M3238_03950 [Actinomycetota bacterium]|nr:hypothetical protein [Actinomycetota bacterium]
MDLRVKAATAFVTLALIALTAPAVAREPAPSNDNFASATVVEGVPFTQTLDNRGARRELLEPEPTCSDNRRTVWYSFTPAEDMNLVAEASGTFKTTVAVYGGSAQTDLTEVACSGGSPSSKVEFAGASGQTYFIQLGSATFKGGLVDFKLSPSAWQERVLREVSERIHVPEQNVAVARFHGRPRPTNPNMYDLTVSVAGQPQIDRGILSFGLIKNEVRVELVRIPEQTVTVTTTLAYRYDSSQYTCLSDSGEGETCTANSPIKDFEWLTSGEGSRAELIIRVSVAHQGNVIAERTVTVPFAGQAGGIAP